MTIDCKENDSFLKESRITDDCGKNLSFRFIFLFFWRSFLTVDTGTYKNRKQQYGTKIPFHSEPRRRPSHRSLFTGKSLIIPLADAGAAKGAAFHYDFTLEIDAFAALGANDAGTFEAGKILG